MKTPTAPPIDLPRPPFETAVAEGPLNDAPIIVHLLNGSTLHGNLRHLNIADEIVAIQETSRNEVIKIPFARLQHIAFTRELTISSEEHPLEPRTRGIESPDVQMFRVTFKDDKSVTGKTCSSIVNQAGLHFFTPINEYSVARMFIPTTVVKHYHIAPLPDHSPARNTSIPSQEITVTTSTDKSQCDKKIGEYLLENLAVNVDQLKQALDHQASQNSDMIGQLLIKDQTITSQQLKESLNKQARDRKKNLGDHLEKMGVIGADEAHLTLARKLEIPFVSLQNFDFDPHALMCVPQDIARLHLLIPLFFYHDRLVIAMDDPTNLDAIDVVRFITGMNLEPTIATLSDIKTAINECYDNGEIEEDIVAAEDARIATSSSEEENKALNKAKRLSEEKPIVRLVNRIIVDAIRRRASDIHIRPLEKRVDLLFRIDGTLITVRSFNKDLLAAVVSRIKILGRMDIAERRLPQDGQSRVSNNATVVDLRISVIPTVNGESVVIRLLNTDVGLKSISQLGFNPHDAEIVTDLLHKSYGMILVTGPTGSGKSTTLYAALQEVIEQNVNIITVEDPVEYHIDGIEQIQVNTATGYTFARALRNILRHDPDVIMIGEIRDQETAKIAIESALTGHLVLSTLHTNDTAGAVTRLLEMGTEPFLLNATLLGILAQRLIRKNCPHCIEEETPDPLARKILGVQKDETFFRGKGCEHCNETGYSGRMAVYELLTLTPAIRTLIQQSGSSDAIHAQALKDGMTPLTQNALAQARQRTTSLMEVYRVRLE